MYRHTACCVSLHCVGFTLPLYVVYTFLCVCPSPGRAGADEQMYCVVALCGLYTAVVYTFLCVCPSPRRGGAGVLGCSLVLAVSGFYSARDDVVELNPSNFNREVIQSDSLWLIEFYAPW